MRKSNTEPLKDVLKNIPQSNWRRKESERDSTEKIVGRN
jgi:hypothetical protein